MPVKRTNKIAAAKNSQMHAQSFEKSGNTLLLNSENMRRAALSVSHEQIVNPAVERSIASKISELIIEIDKQRANANSQILRDRLEREKKLWDLILRKRGLSTQAANEVAKKATTQVVAKEISQAQKLFDTYVLGKKTVSEAISEARKNWQHVGIKRLDFARNSPQDVKLTKEMGEWGQLLKKLEGIQSEINTNGRKSREASLKNNFSLQLKHKEEYAGRVITNATRTPRLIPQFLKEAIQKQRAAVEASNVTKNELRKSQLDATIKLWGGVISEIEKLKQRKA